MKPNGSVLVVDNDGSILVMLDEYLSGRGFRVETAKTGEETLTLLETTKFEVALLALELPSYTGLELISRLNSIQPEIKCIIMTISASLESTIEALRLNAFDYILKPFDLDKVGEVVEAAKNYTMIERENSRTIKRLELANNRLKKSQEILNRRILRTNKNLAEANESLKKHVTRLKMLYQMGRDISSNENWSDALDRFLMALYKYVEAKGTALMMFSNAGNVLNVRTSFHIEEKLLQKAIKLLLEAQKRDALPSEIFHLESCAGGKVNTCLEMNRRWEHTIIPLLYKGRWLGFLLIKKVYNSRREYLNDYHFINTIQTIITEEVANAVNISHLRNLKNFNETILENINSGVLTTDREGKIVFLNSMAKEILGVTANEGILFDDLFQNHFGREDLFEHLMSIEDRSCSLEGILSLTEGKNIPVRLSTKKVETDDYHGKTIVAIFDDMTEQKAMEKELRRADRLRSLGAISAGVAHEIRNPLTGIATAAQVLKEKLGNEPEKTKYLSVILDEINRLDEIIRNLLLFARPISPNPTKLSLGNIVEGALQLLTEKALEKGVTISLVNKLEDDYCFMDGDQIKQIILNITMNAIQACNSGGSVAVQLRVPADPALVQIEFKDTGNGIPFENEDKLYNPFFTTRSDGTGLGLPISRKIIESHGGRIFHRSEVGQGTSFFIELPRKILISSDRENTAKVS
ncbi:MAG: response regulator [Candidatus Krumholzibacteria bacterium]|nr:response regulator [Candidatus Krumholzibacteria bacterium]